MNAGIIGKTQVTDGNPQVVHIEDKQWNGVQNVLRLQANEIDKADGLVNENVVLDELGISKKTLKNMISSGKIARHMYTIAVNGLKKFWINKILGKE